LIEVKQGITELREYAQLLDEEGKEAWREFVVETCAAYPACRLSRDVFSYLVSGLESSLPDYFAKLIPEKEKNKSEETFLMFLVALTFKPDLQITVDTQRLLLEDLRCAIDNVGVNPRYPRLRKDYNLNKGDFSSFMKRGNLIMQLLSFDRVVRIPVVEVALMWIEKQLLVEDCSGESAVLANQMWEKLLNYTDDALSVLNSNNPTMQQDIFPCEEILKILTAIINTRVDDGSRLKNAGQFLLFIVKNAEAESNKEKVVSAINNINVSQKFLLFDEIFKACCMLGSVAVEPLRVLLGTKIFERNFLVYSKLIELVPRGQTPHESLLNFIFHAMKNTSDNNLERVLRITPDNYVADALVFAIKGLSSPIFEEKCNNISEIEKRLSKSTGMQTCREKVAAILLERVRALRSSDGFSLASVVYAFF